MGMTVTETLTAQGLDASDLEANRAGRVSDKQIARQVAVRRGGALGVWLMAGIGIVGGGVGAAIMARGGNGGGAVVIALLGLVMAALPLGIYHAFRFVDPAKLAKCKVTRLDNAEVGVFLPSSNRGVYAISLNHQRYSGFATELGRTHFGARVNAYVVPEHRIVLALEPVA